MKKSQQPKESWYARLMPTLFSQKRKFQRAETQSILDKIEAKLEGEYLEQRQQQINAITKNPYIFRNPQQKTMPYNFEDFIAPQKDFRAWLEQRAAMKDVAHRFLINMELANGEHVRFFVVTVAESFLWNKGRYIIDHTMKYYDLSTKTYCLDYHENFAIPIKRKFDIDAARKSIQRNHSVNIVHAMNPLNMELWMQSEMIGQIIKGGPDIDEKFAKIRFWLIIVSCGVGAALILLLKASGYIHF